MDDRFFSDNIQYKAVLLNLEKNGGQLKCTLCGKILTSKAQCHFDHIVAYARGGKSTLDNCQILCNNCNLSKSDKEMHDFVLEEKAKRFMSGETINDDEYRPASQKPANKEIITKEKFDDLVGEFIKNHGSIKRVDFTREKNGLPSVTYITKYYGSMNALKLAFGLNIDPEWNRESIWETLIEYSKTYPDFKQSDLVKENGVPSLPCILSYYPEFKNFSDIRTALGLDLNYVLWTKEKIMAVCAEYLKTHRRITQKDLRKENGLPTHKVIRNFFGSMQNFQEEIGSEVSKTHEFVSKEQLLAESEKIIHRYGSTFESRSSFLEVFPFHQTTILSRYNTFDSFINDAGITILNTKKAKYTKKEVDDAILSYLKNGGSIPPTSKRLTELKLPSSSTILRFYEDWKEPFVLFSKMINITSK